MTVKAVLWDADGVLQQVPSSWVELLTEVIGKKKTRELLTDVLPVAQEAMRGRAALRPHLEKMLAEHGIVDAGEQVREVWGTFDRYDDTRTLVAQVRQLGLGCHLATNQDEMRASYMRARLGYEDLLDSCFYSCEMGVAKPDVEFFTHIAAALGLEPRELVFIDDTELNVMSASGCGIQAIHWHHRDGIETLRAALSACGVELPVA